MNDDLMASLSIDDLVGTWRVVRTEIPGPYDPQSEVFHFSPDGLHYWEYPLEQRCFRFRYELTDAGVRLSVRDGEYPRELLLRTDDGFLVLTGPHGYSSWLQRIPASERPPQLRYFFASRSQS